MILKNQIRRPIDSATQRQVKKGMPKNRERYFSGSWLFWAEVFGSIDHFVLKVVVAEKVICRWIELSECG